MIDYAEFESAIGLNWYDIDPNLQLLMRRLLAPVDLDQVNLVHAQPGQL